MKTPGTLEQRMLEAIRGKVLSKEETAKACAEIALEEIRKAYSAGFEFQWQAHFGVVPNPAPNLEEYLLEQNLIEKK